MRQASGWASCTWPITTWSTWPAGVAGGGEHAGAPAALGAHHRRPVAGRSRRDLALMRALLQRVSRAEVRVDGGVIAQIDLGLVVLLGVGQDDDDPTAEPLARQIVELRIFRDDAGKTNRSILEAG